MPPISKVFFPSHWKDSTPSPFMIICTKRACKCKQKNKSNEWSMNPTKRQKLWHSLLSSPKNHTFWPSPNFLVKAMPTTQADIMEKHASKKTIKIKTNPSRWETTFSRFSSKWQIDKKIKSLKDSKMRVWWNFSDYYQTKRVK